MICCVESQSGSDTDITLDFVLGGVMAEATPKTFTIRSVMGPAFRVLFRNLVPFGFIAAVIQGIPYLVLLAVYPDLSGGVQNEEVDVSGEFTFGAEAGGWTFLFFILSHFVTATLVYGAV